MRFVFALGSLMMAFSSLALAADPVPSCRLDPSARSVVAQTLDSAIRAFRALDKALLIDAVEVNPAAPARRPNTLSAFVVLDAAPGKITPQGCPTAPLARGDPLDGLSVRGGCVIVALDTMEMRCSAGAITIFGNVDQRSDRANPALLYVLAHELAHLYQRRVGEYAGRVERIALIWDRAAKLKALRDGCDPVSVRREEEADTLSLQVLAALLTAPPYRETTFSERGSLYWNIDQLALATNAWQQAAVEREFNSQPKLHVAFEPTELPSPQKSIERNARRFVCEVLTRRQGTILYPGKGVTHPPLEQRLRRISEALQPVASQLPATGAARDFEPIARLQQDLGPIFTHIYRETGVYLEAVQDNICTIVNDPKVACH